MAADIKMDELLVRWMSSDSVFETLMSLVETERQKNKQTLQQQQEVLSCTPPLGSTSNGINGVSSTTEGANSSSFSSSMIIPPPPSSPKFVIAKGIHPMDGGGALDHLSDSSPTEVASYIIPPLFPARIRRSSGSNNRTGSAGRSRMSSANTSTKAVTTTTTTTNLTSDNSSITDVSPSSSTTATAATVVTNDDDQSWAFLEQTNLTLRKAFCSGSPTATSSLTEFLEITKDVCKFPSFFNAPLYRRILLLFGKTVPSSNSDDDKTPTTELTYTMFQKYWIQEMEPYDEQERFFRLVKKPSREYITRDDFLPFIEELLMSHPGLEFLSNHAEFQEKYAVTVITRIFYTLCCRRCGGSGGVGGVTTNGGKITLRQLKRSNLLEAMHNVDTEDDINKVTQYFSYEHFYVLYCRFWELDHDRDYLITREDLLKYAESSLSHTIVDRIFEAAPRPFDTSSIVPTTTSTTTTTTTTTINTGMNNNSSTTNTTVKREHLSYEDFIFFMLSEEDKSNEMSVRYWFTCVDVDGDGRLGNFEMRSFYNSQLQRMASLGHEVIPFEDMLCQMMDMIKPKSHEYFVVEDFLQEACSQVSGALFDALFNLNKYLQFEQRDPFMERQKREDEFECDWDRFACIDYNRLAMEEEAREEEAMEIDWVTADEDDDDGDDFNPLGTVEAPF